MTAPADLFSEVNDGGAAHLSNLLHTAEIVLVKKLSNNDRDWAQKKNKHQGGVYIPVAQRDGGFFPTLTPKERPNGAKEIREASFRTDWPQFDESRSETHLVNYTSKGAETHMTRLPKAAFATLSPASFLVMGRYENDQGISYRCLTIDSNSEDALVLTDVFALEAEFVIDTFRSRDMLAIEREKILDFADQVFGAWSSSTILEFASESASMPDTVTLATKARAKYLTESGLADLNPFLMTNPGDAVREISRNIEWDLFRDYQRRERAVALVRTILGDTPRKLTVRDMLRAVVNNVAEIDRLMLSASQQRKSRAGYSFEHHIEAMLVAGKVPFAKQVVMEAKKRPDFVLPSLAQLKAPRDGSPPGLILSAKTTLRERWKQVQREMTDGRLFLATVDESVAANAIEDMASLGIMLVVPESLKISKSTEYVRHGNVLDFKTFFDEELRQRRMPGWSMAT